SGEEVQNPEIMRKELIAIEQNPEIMRNEKKFDQKTNNFATSTWWKDTKGMQIKETKTLSKSMHRFNLSLHL
ncbi:hypothetical protein ACJX0J_037839, partial [Zea mays]